jgi:hypothetical protein
MGKKVAERHDSNISANNYDLIVLWLEIDGNKEKMDGVESKTKVGEKTLVKN